jgi:hypothetical protein
MIEHGVDIDAKRPMWDCNHTALHMTAENGALNLSRMLLDAGADPNIRDDKYGATALGWAEFFRRDELAALVREKAEASKRSTFALQRPRVGAAEEAYRLTPRLRAARCSSRLVPRPFGPQRQGRSASPKPRSGSGRLRCYCDAWLSSVPRSR